MLLCIHGFNRLVGRRRACGADVKGRIAFKNCELGEGIVHAVACSQMRWNGGVKAGKEPTKTIVYETENVKMAPGCEVIGKLPNRP